MLLTCPSCKTKNFLDPYPFWNFKGTTQCAGCKKIWRLETSNGACIGAPAEGSGKADLLPGFAETQAYEPISGAGLTRPAPKAQKETVCKPKAIKRNPCVVQVAPEMVPVSPFPDASATVVPVPALNEYEANSPVRVATVVKVEVVE